MIRFGGEEMPKPYSYDLRVRVIELIEAGSSRREAARTAAWRTLGLPAGELGALSPSAVIITNSSRAEDFQIRPGAPS